MLNGVCPVTQDVPYFLLSEPFFLGEDLFERMFKLVQVSGFVFEERVTLAQIFCGLCEASLVLWRLLLA